ncbi:MULTISPECIES: hypothetical protein [Croceitalea]|uniref:DUF4890 domain-containing protein n=1 Tax=Croceitalea vernalis TaxID=3075599 RepID=A0ABU3BGQ5_9FLAO|nr:MULTISPECIES: hypothetical protein [unclassified Croceitalea]MDT0539555.1 hypothetical protein [Croceitalea sp. P059]MDT0621347.1 hypothetical protein [Croceitalea sp. P007]
MKVIIQVIFLILFLNATTIAAQYGYGNQYGRQRQRSAIPQTPTPTEEPKPKTAEELVDDQMPRISETLELDPFEQAVVRSTLVKYVTKRIELQILKLEPKKMQEEYEKLADLQTAELKAGLPEDKFNAFVELQEKRFQTKKKKKKKKKKKNIE